MKCDRQHGDERTCGCGAAVTAFALILREGQPAKMMCAGCLDLDALRADAEGEMVEVRCEQCKNLFATDPEHSAFFCSLACEQAWRKGKRFERIPF